MGTLTQDQLRQFTGGLTRYRNWLNRRVIYTEGVKYVASEAEAYWLIEAIASHIGSKPFNRAVGEDERLGQIHFWTLTKSPDGSAPLIAKADTPYRPFITQCISFTDFPLTQIEIWAAFDGGHWTLYLPSEH